MIRLYYRIYVLKINEQSIENEIGQFKLENIFTNGIFLASKIYVNITIDIKEIIKVRSYINIINFYDLNILLIKDKIKKKNIINS